MNREMLIQEVCNEMKAALRGLAIRVEREALEKDRERTTALEDVLTELVLDMDHLGKSSAAKRKAEKLLQAAEECPQSPSTIRRDARWRARPRKRAL
jgi:nitrogen fixation/metabolism regulation signal transduction histidine kinase